MLRQLAEEQLSDCFTIGKAVTEFLGEEMQTGALLSSPYHPSGSLFAQEPFAAGGLPITESVRTEYAEECRQTAETQELAAVGNDRHVNKPG